ncbi:MAG: hypothetical protein IJF73_00980 [Clostridia bacterium]|nr:hypothetical protein [Clostridia bacterium]
MSRLTVQEKKEQLPLALNRLIVSLVGDYERRASVLRRKAAAPDVLDRYHALNRLIDEAIAEVCEEGICRQMRLDIGEGRGARRSPLYYMGEGLYKRRKRAAKERIAEKLGLL